LAYRNVETWYSEQDIVPGENYIRRIEDGLLKCDWMLVILTAHATGSDWVRAEVNTAMNDPRFRGRVLPVRVDSALASQITPSFGSLDVLDVRGSSDIGEAIYQFLVERERQLRSTPLS
jgi:hypothetical protein